MKPTIVTRKAPTTLEKSPKLGTATAMMQHTLTSPIRTATRMSASRVHQHKPLSLSPRVTTALREEEENDPPSSEPPPLLLLLLKLLAWS